jgi:hypothetical protein
MSVIYSRRWAGAARSEAAAIELWHERRFSLSFPTRGEYADWIFVAWVFGREERREIFSKISTGLETQDQRRRSGALAAVYDRGTAWLRTRSGYLHIPDTVIWFVFSVSQNLLPGPKTDIELEATCARQRRSYHEGITDLPQALLPPQN